MNILGINHYFHDSSACVVRDGRLVCAIEEERLNRDKHTTAFPRRAIAKCLELAKIGVEDVDHVALSIKPTHNWTQKVRYALANPRQGVGFLKAELSRLNVRQRGLASWILDNFSLRIRPPAIHFVEHHLSHVAGSFVVSPYEEAALLGMDGSGEWATALLGCGRGNDITCFGRSYFPMSIGSFYEAVTEFCGFRPNYDEGKTMGLAPYGDSSRFYDEVARMVRVDEEGNIDLDLSYFDFQYHGTTRCAPKFHDVFGSPRRKGEDFAQNHKDAAAAFQRVLEERALELCRVLRRRTGMKYLVVAGGVALNSVMNGRIVRESGFNDLYVMPGAGDNGTSIGAAFYVYNTVLGNSRVEVHSDPYVGTSYSDEEIKRVIDSLGVEAQLITDPERRAAAALHAGKIVGWFQGRMEFGPRALGNRSVLANPTLPDMKQALNARVKHREAFRPFAPSCVAECRRDYFEIEVEAPFMLKVCYVLPEKRSLLPAITHVDGSARLQTVRREVNPTYHRLMQEFGQLSGVPVVLNTSFNVMGQPIVESPRQAIECYLGTGIDELFVGNWFLTKQPAA
jgi:carbamoyltransferase